MGLKRGDIAVLSLDPYFVGSDKDYDEAQWAARNWDQMMQQRRKPIHLRGFHYYLQSRRTPKPDDTIYADQDPAKDWQFLLRAAQVARYLALRVG